MTSFVRHGQGVLEDDKEAVKWYRKDAEPTPHPQGHLETTPRNQISYQLMSNAWSATTFFSRLFSFSIYRSSLAICGSIPPYFFRHR